MQKSHAILASKTLIPKYGVFFAALIWFTWCGLLIFNLLLPVQFLNISFYVLILIQTHLFTGLFITAHDAMHGTASFNKTINSIIGTICLWSFAANRWSVLLPKHHLHHKHVGTAKDPDFAPKPFWLWYFKFLKEYISWQQILLIAVLFNIAQVWINQSNLIFFYVIPSVLSTLQLFYFGTYLPHRGEHQAHNHHKARSQPKNHLWAFISCYFFGYHYEHHDLPQVPWWLLPLTK